MNTILGRKKEMTQIFDDKSGNVIPVTLIDVAHCNVVGKKVKDKDGYNALKLGYGIQKNPNMPEAGKYKGMKVPRYVREVRTDEDVAVGTEVKADIFTVGDKVEVTGWSKGRGFAGVMKKFGFHGTGDRTHGQSNMQRHIGSIGAQTPGRVMKGKTMPGRMGNDKVTVKNLKVLFIDAEANLIGVKGAVPGAKNSYVIVTK